MDEYPKMIYKSAQPFRTPEEVAGGIASKAILTAVVKDMDEEDALAAEGFGPLESLGTKRRAPKIVPDAQEV